jgi:hypothetical protein
MGGMKNGTKSMKRRSGKQSMKGINLHIFWEPKVIDR